MCLLTVDIGNTRTKFAIYSHATSKTSAGLLPAPRWHGSIATALPTEPLSADLSPEQNWVRSLFRALELAESGDRECRECHPDDGSPPPEPISSQAPENPRETWISSVVPDRVQALLQHWPAFGWGHPKVVRSVLDIPLTTNLSAPSELGVDRALSAFAASQIRQPHGRMVIISAGTATTVDLIDARGVFRGGSILPGLNMGAQALHEFTAKLPEIPIPPAEDPPPVPFGRETASAIWSGLYWGQVGAIRELIARLTSLSTEPVQLLLTGGHGPRLAQSLGGQLTLIDDLPLRGLAVLAQMRRGNADRGTDHHS